MIAMLSKKAPASVLLALTSFGLLLMTACSVLPERKPTTIYEPARIAAVPGAGTPVAWSLVVAQPEAGQLLDDDRIVVRPTPGSVQVYQDASWSDPVPDLLQTALVRGFEDSARILAVGRPGAALSSDYLLHTDLRAFDAVYAQPGSVQAEIEVFAKLVRNSDGKVVAAQRFRETQPASGEAVPLVVDAFSVALSRASGKIVAWTLDSGQPIAAPAAKR